MTMSRWAMALVLGGAMGWFPHREARAEFYEETCVDKCKEERDRCTPPCRDADCRKRCAANFRNCRESCPRVVKP